MNKNVMYRGEWADDVKYAPNDCVFYQKTMYNAIKENIGQIPFDLHSLCWKPEPEVADPLFAAQHAPSLSHDEIAFLKKLVNRLKDHVKHYMPKDDFGDVDEQEFQKKFNEAQDRLIYNIVSNIRVN